jgi:Transposase
MVESDGFRYPVNVLDREVQRRQPNFVQLVRHRGSLLKQKRLSRDLPAKLSARARVFSTGQGRKTDPVDAHSVAVVALRTNGLRQVTADDTTVALRLLVDRRHGLGRARTDTINRIHKLLLELLPGGAKKFLSAPQARAMLNTTRPRDIVGRTRRQLASELLAAILSGNATAARPQARRHVRNTHAVAVRRLESERHASSLRDKSRGTPDAATVHRV